MTDITQCPKCGRPVVSKRVDACLYCGAALRPGEEGEPVRGVVRMEEALAAPVTGAGYHSKGFWASLFDWGFAKYVLFGLVLGTVIFTAVLWTMRSVRKMSERQNSIAENALRRSEEAQGQAFQKQMEMRRAVQEAEGKGTPYTSAKQLELARRNLAGIQEALNAYGERYRRYPETLTPDAYEIAWLAKAPLDLSALENRRIVSYRRVPLGDTLEAFELVALAADGRHTEIRTSDTLRLRPR